MCSVCKTEKDSSEFTARQLQFKNSSWCKRCLKFYSKARLYGITVADFFALVAEQKGECAICSEQHGEELYVDHDHETGAIRGLLCHKCNSALGLLGEDPERLRTAAEYIETYQIHFK